MQMRPLRNYPLSATFYVALAKNSPPGIPSGADGYGWGLVREGPDDAGRILLEIPWLGLKVHGFRPDAGVGRGRGPGVY